MDFDNYRTVVVLGLAGKGKSSILNTLISGDPNSNIFIPEKSKVGGTKAVEMQDGQIFGLMSPVYTFIDIPRMLPGDPYFKLLS